MILDINGIQKVIPHRYPFLLVDAIEEVDPKKRIVGIKNVTINEHFFQGHFPAKPVMPGVLILESLAQTGAVLLLMAIDQPEKKLIFLAGMENVRFRRPVVPGDQLKLEVLVTMTRGDFYKMDSKARVNGDVVAEASMMCKIVDLADLEPPAQKSPGKTE
jgi:beta-hydroxyacyl-ACP dehydratase FabZ